MKLKKQTSNNLEICGIFAEESHQNVLSRGVMISDYLESTLAALWRMDCSPWSKLSMAHVTKLMLIE